MTISCSGDILTTDSREIQRQKTWNTKDSFGLSYFFLLSALLALPLIHKWMQFCHPDREHLVVNGKVFGYHCVVGVLLLVHSQEAKDVGTYI